MTTDHKFFLCNTEKLQQSIKMQLFKKQKVHFELCVLISKSTWNFEHFCEKKDEAPHSLYISEKMDSERRSWNTSK